MAWFITTHSSIIDIALFVFTDAVVSPAVSPPPPTFDNDNSHWHRFLHAVIISDFSFFMSSQKFAFSIITDSASSFCQINDWKRRQRLEIMTHHGLLLLFFHHRFLLMMMMLCDGPDETSNSDNWLHRRFRNKDYASQNLHPSSSQISHSSSSQIFTFFIINTHVFSSRIFLSMIMIMADDDNWIQYRYV